MSSDASDEAPPMKKWKSQSTDDMMSPPSKHLSATPIAVTPQSSSLSQRTKKAKRVRHVSIQVPKSQLESVKAEIEAGTFDVNRFAQTSSLVISGPFKGQQAGGVRARVIKARVTPETPELTLPFQSDLRPPQDVTQTLCHRKALVQQLLASRNESSIYAAMGALKKSKPGDGDGQPPDQWAQTVASAEAPPSSSSSSNAASVPYNPAFGSGAV